ncbi:hypothetical protein EDB86DRAFT_2831003 [Lactarius hatsudake]|nr:hypothetical protein EDB86DRAFT_2831003 [Lactarius hatsudake]
MNEDDTTSSSRIFVKIMMQEVTESMGLPTLKDRFADPEIKALRDQLLHKCRTWCFHRRYARASQKCASSYHGATPCNVGGRIIVFRHFLGLPTRPLTPPLPILTLTPTRQMVLATVTAAAVLRLLRVALSRILPVVGATTAAHHLRCPVFVGTSCVADAMTVAHHHHLAPGGMTIEGTTRVVVMDGTVANRLRGIVGAVFRTQGRPLVGATTARVSVRRHHHRGRAGETVIETGITTAEEMTRGTDTEIAGAEMLTGGLSTCFVLNICPILRYVFMCTL